MPRSLIGSRVVSESSIDPVFLWPLLIATFGFSLLFGGVMLARMRAILADTQAEARLRRKALQAEEMAR